MAGPRPSHLDGYITIGQFVGPHGIKGGLKVKVLTDFVERFDKGRTIFCNGEESVIKHSSWHKDQVRIQIASVKDRNQAEELRWHYLFVPEDDAPELEEGEYLTSELIGLSVVTADGRTVGKIEDILPSPAHDILVVGEGMIPAVSEFVTDINFETQTVTVNLISGMVPGFEEE